MVGSTETPAYIEAARKIGINITEIVADGQDHGFGQNYYMADYLEWLKKHCQRGRFSLTPFLTRKGVRENRPRWHLKQCRIL